MQEVVQRTVGNITDHEAVELEKQLLNKNFRAFQEMHSAQLEEMHRRICSECGECVGSVSSACGLIASMTWHVFSVYFTAKSRTN